jgi:hypothetical protein
MRDSDKVMIPYVVVIVLIFVAAALDPPVVIEALLIFGVFSPVEIVLMALSHVWREMENEEEQKSRGGDCYGKKDNAQNCNRRSSR